MKQQIQVNFESASKLLSELELNFTETCDKIKQNLLNSQKIQMQKYEGSISEIKRQVEDLEKNKQIISIVNENQLKAYLNDYFQRIDELECPNRIIKNAMNKIKQIKAIQVKVDEAKISLISNTLKQLHQQRFIFNLRVFHQSGRLSAAPVFNRAKLL